MSTPPKTEHWIDLYTMVLDQLAENLRDPKDWFERLGIKPGEEGAIALPKKLDEAAYLEQQNAWASVKRDLRIFGLELGESLMLAPEILNPQAKPTHGQALVRWEYAMKKWEKEPWLEISHELEVVPVRFRGRDALLALGFISFWIQQCNKVDPIEETKKMLNRQGITAENFAEHADRLMIKNPWA